MYTRRELQNAIRDCERSAANYQNIEKLAHLYAVYDHLYKDTAQTVINEESVIGDYGQGEFFETIRGADAAKVWAVMGELMDAVAVMNPKLYESAMLKLKGGA